MCILCVNTFTLDFFNLFNFAKPLRRVMSLTGGLRGSDNSIHSKATDISARTQTPVQRYFNCQNAKNHIKRKYLKHFDATSQYARPATYDV